jgi:hypothetical protein
VPCGRAGGNTWPGSPAPGLDLRPAHQQHRIGRLAQAGAASLAMRGTQVASHKPNADCDKAMRPVTHRFVL